jgi:hypothetical protein
MANGKCRMHGGASTGPKTAEGRARIAAARTIHGAYGAEMRATQARVTALTTRGRVLCAMGNAGLDLQALPPLIGQIRGSTSCAVRNKPTAPLPGILTLTPPESRQLVRMIRAVARQSRLAPDPTDPKLRQRPGSPPATASAFPSSPTRSG